MSIRLSIHVTYTMHCPVHLGGLFKDITDLLGVDVTTRDARGSLKHIFHAYLDDEVPLQLSRTPCLPVYLVQPTAESFNPPQAKCFHLRDSDSPEDDPGGGSGEMIMRTPPPNRILPDYPLPTNATMAMNEDETTEL
ncbi:hypothetical protein Tco_0717871 [Tanacetum coccineum]